ncbi:hypothetical protein NLJ89_g7981 [Agrocybe chaxingu]|uniref:Uncharacterized protein n=1 Tax=Agrocybe chaxingu TaxID=84603 RepID=A0A9W8JVA3_9AGAR|nr:hypothetical protein NLJ89_g7981 [Agrocybe chaxingu]
MADPIGHPGHSLQHPRRPPFPSQTFASRAEGWCVLHTRCGSRSGATVGFQGTDNDDNKFKCDLNGAKFWFKHDGETAGEKDSVVDWGLVKWESLPSLPFPRARTGVPPSPSMSEAGRGRWGSPQQYQHISQGRRPGPAFETPHLPQTNVQATTCAQHERSSVPEAAVDGLTYALCLHLHILFIIAIAIIITVITAMHHTSSIHTPPYHHRR